MQAELAHVIDVSSGPVSTGRASPVVAMRTARAACRSGALWGGVFGLYIASQAFTYASTYNTAVSRHKLAELFGSNSAISALVGPAHELSTVAGFTAWKTLTVLSVMGAVWGLLTGTRLLRGEEDAGRFELFLAGRTTRRGAAVQAVVGLCAGLAAFFVITALITLAAGRSHKVAWSPGAALVFALSAVAGAGLFLAVGALASQLFATRRRAAMASAAVLGVSYAIRMVADGGRSLSWLRWLSPLGWVEEIQPLTGNHLLPLLPIAAVIVLLFVLAAHLAGQRDLGAAILPTDDRARPSTRMLSGPGTFGLRLVGGTLLAWAVATTAAAVLLGAIAKSGGEALASSASIERAIGHLGASGANARAYLGFSFLIVALMVSFVATGQISAIRAEEASGRLDNLLVRPVTRTRWLGGRLGTAAFGIVACAVLAGLGAFTGAALDHAGIGLRTLLAAGLNVVPPAICVLGAGTLVLGVWPRAASAAAYGVLTWSVLVELLATSGRVNHVVLDTSVFHQMAAAPATPPDWESAAVLVVVGTVAAALGCLGLARRDIEAQ